MTEKTDQELKEAKGANEPAKLPGRGLMGPNQQPVSKKEARQRRMVLSRLMASSISDEEIIAAVRKQFGVTREYVKTMMRDVYNQWADEDKTRAPYQKHAAKRRIRAHMEKASKDGAHSAVANFEKILAGIEGTLEPLEISTPADSRVSEALLVVLGAQDQSQVRKLVDRGKNVYNNGTPNALPAKKE